MKRKILNHLVVALFSITLFSCKDTGSKEPPLKLIPVSVDKYGYIDETGKTVIPQQYLFGNVFVDGLALVAAPSRKMGYINESGKYIINPIYKFATNFSEGLAFVTAENGGISCIDKNGMVKFSLDEVDNVHSFTDGLASIFVDNKMGFIDKSGKYAINPVYDYVEPFENGIASVELDNKFGYIDTKGKMIIEPQYKIAGSGFNDGLACASLDGSTFGFIDEKGKFAINPTYDSAQSFSQGLAAVKIQNRWGYVDKSGTMVISPQFENAGPFISGRAPVMLGSKWAFIDTKGKFIFNPQFDKLSRIYGSKLALAKTGSNIGIVDKEGKYLVNPQYTHSFLPEEQNTGNFEEHLYFTNITTDKINFPQVFHRMLFNCDETHFRGYSRATTVKDVLDRSNDQVSQRGVSSIVVFGGRDSYNFYIDSVRYDFREPVFYGSKYDPTVLLKDILYHISLHEAASGKAETVFTEFKGELTRLFNATEQVPPQHRLMVAATYQLLQGSKTKLVYLFSDNMYFALIGKEDSIDLFCGFN